MNCCSPARIAAGRADRQFGGHGGATCTGPGRRLSRRNLRSKAGGSRLPCAGSGRRVRTWLPVSTAPVASGETVPAPRSAGTRRSRRIARFSRTTNWARSPTAARRGAGPNRPHRPRLGRRRHVGKPQSARVRRRGHRPAANGQRDRTPSALAEQAPVAAITPVEILAAADALAGPGQSSRAHGWPRVVAVLARRAIRGSAAPILGPA